MRGDEQEEMHDDEGVVSPCSLSPREIVLLRRRQDFESTVSRSRSDAESEDDLVLDEGAFQSTSSRSWATARSRDTSSEGSLLGKKKVEDASSCEDCKGSKQRYAPESSKASRESEHNEEHNQRVCRICFEGEEEKGETLRSNLCGCSGTMALIHKSCLDKWIDSSKILTCEICRETFNLSASEIDEWNARFEQSNSRRQTLSIGVQTEAEEAMFQHVQNRRLRSCLQRTWRNRGAMNSSIIILIGTSVLVMMSLVLYHFLSPTREKVIAGALPPGQNLYKPFNCSMQTENAESVGWLCGVPSSQIYKGDCSSKGDNEPCGEWNKFTLLQSSIPRCFFGHGSICYVALQSDPNLGGVCAGGTCISVNETGQTTSSLRLENSLLVQGRCVSCT